MHASSPVINVKPLSRGKLFRIPCLAFSLHSADGEHLPNDVSLLVLRIPDGGQFYCRIRTNDHETAVEAVQDEHAAAV